jgi:hypothetical protein
MRDVARGFEKRHPILESRERDIARVPRLTRLRLREGDATYEGGVIGIRLWRVPPWLSNGQYFEGLRKYGEIKKVMLRGLPALADGRL